MALAGFHTVSHAPLSSLLLLIVWGGAERSLPEMEVAMLHTSPLEGMTFSWTYPVDLGGHYQLCKDQ